MKRALIRLLVVLVLSIGIVAESCAYLPVQNVSAAEGETVKPAKPKITAKVTKAGNGVKITISKTSDADGYCIYMKAPGAKKYKKIKSVTKDGTAKRSYTKKKLEDGIYYFKVKAYRVVDGTKVFGSYSKVESVEIGAGSNWEEIIATTPEIIEFVNPMGFFGSASIQGDAKGQPCYYDFRQKKGEELPKGAVYRLLSIDHAGTKLEQSSCATVDERAISVAPLTKGTLSVMLFAYANEADADKHENPIARSGRLDITIGDQEDDKIYADITFKKGYAYFGSYPQVKVTDSSIISALKNIPDADGVDGGEYNGKRYICCNNSWYEERPIEWVILEGSADSDSVTLMSNKILLECGYSDWSGYEAGGNWKDSFVRYHLNGYNGSFKSIWTFAFARIAFPGDVARVLMDQSYDGCEDKILLPSKEQLSKLTASQRVRKASDLAKKADSHGYWCIDSDGKGNITLVKPDGTFTTHKAYQQDGEGYVSVIKVDLKKCNVYTK